MSERQKEEGLVFAKPQGSGALVQIGQGRAAAEIQSAMLIAKAYPRDEAAAWARIQQACRRPTLAEAAIYSYPRGGQAVTGPSIRLAEALAQNWGNLDFGVVELEQRGGESTMQAHCWDLETNARQVRVFQVKHERHTRAGTKKLTDPRDVYEMVANQGARRLRACILGVIPGDVVEGAVDACQETLQARDRQQPLHDAVRNMVAAFMEIGITVGMLEQRLGHKLAETSRKEVSELRRIYRSVRDQEVDRAEFFSPEVIDVAQPSTTSEKKAHKPPTPTPASSEPKPQPTERAWWLDEILSLLTTYQDAHDGQDPPDWPGEFEDEATAKKWIDRFGAQATADPDF